MARQSGRDRRRIEITLAPDVWAYLKKPEVNASGAVEAAIRRNTTDAALERAGMEHDDVDLDEMDRYRTENEEESQ